MEELYVSSLLAKERKIIPKPNQAYFMSYFVTPSTGRDFQNYIRHH